MKRIKATAYRDNNFFDYGAFHIFKPPVFLK
jgi:hypothetical protein